MPVIGPMGYLILGLCNVGAAEKIGAQDKKRAQQHLSLQSFRGRKTFVRLFATV